MKYKIEIDKVQTVDEIKEYWTNEDYVQLLEKFDYADAEDSKNREFKRVVIYGNNRF